MQLVDSSTENRPEVVNEARSEDFLRSATSVGAAATTEADCTTRYSGHESGYTVWRVACGDMINRARSLAVYVDGGEVVLVGPPGESARLTGSQLDELKAALDEAAKQAER